MTNSKSIVLRTNLIILILIIPCAIFSQSKNERIEKYLSEIVSIKSFSGSIAVAIEDSLLINKGYGYADYENNILNSDSTVHRVGSLTKQLTAVGILILLGDSIPLTTSVSKYFQEIPESVTIHHLLTHTSGVPDLFGDMDAVPVEDTYVEINKVLQEKIELINPPGKQFQYNNFGYVLLGRLIEILSGTSYYEYLKKHVLLPAGMLNTYYDNPSEIINNRSQGYRLGSKKERLNDALKDPAAYSAGGMLSTTSDMLKFAQAILDGTLLSQIKKEKMFLPNLNNYGLGWQVVTKNGKVMFNHNGGTHGFNSRLVIYPDENVIIAVLGNNEDVRAASISCDIESIIFNDASQPLSIPIDIDKAKLISYEGTFTDESGSLERSFHIEDQSLYFVNDNNKYELKALSENVFCFSSYEDVRIRFLNQNEFELSYCSVDPLVFRRN